MKCVIMQSPQKKEQSNCTKLIENVTFRDGECRGPLGPQYIQANTTIAVYIWMIDACGECHLKERKVKQLRKNKIQLVQVPLVV